MILMRTKKMMFETDDKYKIEQLKKEGWIELEKPLKVEKTKEDYFKILDDKQIDYKKSYGLAKLKELAGE